MTPTSEFWMTWTVQVTIAVGTVSAVLVALFGGWLRAHLAPPRLTLKFENAEGVKTPVTLTAPDGNTRRGKGRWYHARVSNEHRWSPATQVQVFLLRVEDRDAAGEFKVTWLGEIPIRWSHQEIKPLVRTIGHADDCDLCSVVEDKWIEVHPLIVPHRFHARREGPCEIITTFQARGVEAYSNLLRVRIAWDGKWSDDAGEMSRHMVVKEVD